MYEVAMYELFTIPLLRQRGTFLWSQRTSATVDTHEKGVFVIKSDAIRNSRI